jgi:cystathionine gamma-synthase
MALAYKNWCICSFSESTVSARQPRPASIRGIAAAMPLKQQRRSHPGLSPLAPAAASPAARRAVASRVAQAQVPEAEVAPEQRNGQHANGNGAASSSSSGAPEQQHKPTHCLSTARASTRAVHGGENAGRLRQGVADSLTTPIVQTSTYTFKNTAELIAYQEGRHKSFEYGRYGNPTARVVEEKIMSLEGAEDCLLSSSGMCSATTMLLALVPQGGHIVTTTDCYRRTRQFIQTVLPKMGISCTVLDPADLRGLERALEQQHVSLFFSESPTNPYLRCVDIRAISKL